MNIICTNLYKQVTKESNIYTAIYSVESYVFERGLLSDEDIRSLNRLSDKYDFDYIDGIIGECKKRLAEIFTNSDELFETTVYFKLKKYNEKKDIISYRPLHTTDLITQICIVCMLNVIMFEDTEDSRQLSDISKLLPSNFYGNIPSTNIDSLFIPWKLKYKEYSDKVITAYHEYRSTDKYKYEVSLDLQQFFPSVNPAIIYSHIIDRYSSMYFGEELECLKILVKKLLYFKVLGITGLDKNYYGDFLIPDCMECNLYSLGIPQGLPQAYFFGNLCMIDVAKLINEKFKGDSFYYVDDSVLYTNEIDDNFLSKIESINAKLKELTQDIKHKPKLSDEIVKFEQNIAYCIKIHTGEKSSYSKITEGNYGLSNLLLITKNVSNIPFEISSTIDEVEDSTIREKIITILNAIEKEITLVKSKKESSPKDKYNTYLKLLARYRKFYLFRLRIMLLRDDNSTVNFEELYYKAYPFLKDTDNLDKIAVCDIIDDSIFLAETHLLLKNLCFNSEKQSDLIKSISNFEKKLTPAINSRYFEKDLNGAQFQQVLLAKPYGCLKEYVRQAVEPIFKGKHELIINNIKSIIDLIMGNNDKNRCVVAEFLHIKKEYIEFVYKTSNSYKRLMLNAIFSNHISVPINDSCSFIKEDNRAIKYYELRLLMYLRNYSFNIDDFIHFSKQLTDECSQGQWQEKMDFALLEVLPLFKQSVRNPKEIDDLILIHKYVNGLWKNGSKFLHFYTLHNEEHSVELIKLCLRITKSIDYFKLKERDYFILFSACYLHDISMVLYPNIDRFTENKFSTDVIYTEWKEELRKLKFEDCNKSEAKRFILNYFEKVNSYFESESRGNHSKRSASFIKNVRNKDLNFIDNVIRETVANISEAHGYWRKDVYGLKSQAKDSIFSEKYLMILLRLADLLDMSKDRVSINILKQNIEYMPTESKFHWISHMAIDKCDIRTKYKLNISFIKESKNESFLQNGAIDETVVIDIYLNTKLLAKPSIASTNCTNINSIIDVKQKKIRIIMDNNHCSDKCNFLCKWMSVKNEYLYQELNDLQKYLNRNNNNLFGTNMEVELHYHNSNSIPSDYIDIIEKRIN